MVRVEHFSFAIATFKMFLSSAMTSSVQFKTEIK